MGRLIWALSDITGIGAIAQLGERVLCKHEVVGSIPSGSTNFVGAGDSADAELAASTLIIRVIEEDTSSAVSLAPA